MPKTTTVGLYLIARLEELGVKHIFGIPGDYVLRFYDLLVASNIKLVGTCSEAGAGFAGDAYARVNGLGAVCVTYCVGGLNVVNAVAGAYAEKSPLVVITGAPGMAERERHPLLHHRVRDFDTQRAVFEKITAVAETLGDPAEAPRQIDRALLTALRQKRPVFLELPRDMVDAPCAPPKPLALDHECSDPAPLKEAVAEAAAMLRAAKRPVILAGIEIQRFAIQKHLLRLVEHAGYPVAATLLGKSVISELHPQYLGIYEGAMGREAVRKRVENADCVLFLGDFMTDINLGIFTARLDLARTIHATSEKIAIKHHGYDGILLKDFMDGLTRALPKGRAAAKVPLAARPTPPKPFRVRPNAAVTVKRFFERMNELLDEHTTVISDPGDSLFGATDLTIHRGTEFLSPAYYTSMGFAVPAALGAQVNRRAMRPLVFVGDGAFQMTGQEISSIVRQGLNPIIFVLNNKGYTTERFIQDGPYNDIHDWAFHRWPEVMRAGLGLEARTEGELEKAITAAWRNVAAYSIINLHLDPMDRSNALQRLGERMGSQIRDSSRKR